MKKIYLASLVLIFALTGCSQKADEELVLRTYGDNPLLQSILSYEDRDTRNEDVYEMYALKCMLFANKNEDLNATLYMKEKIEQVKKEYPKNAQILAYYATTVGLIARDDENVTNKMTYADKSIALIDKAVAMDKENPIIRLTRGHLMYSLPSMFNRQDTAAQDYDFLISCITDGSCSFSDEEVANIYFNRADLKRREGELDDAVTYYEKVPEIVPDTEIAARAEKKAVMLRE